MQRNNVVNIYKHKYVGILLILISVVAGIICGCAENRHAIVAVTGTNIGLEISQNPATQTPQGKLGYQRSEIAIVPTNRSAGVDAKKDGKGAEDLGDVLMELRFANIFSFTSGGIYQRLAVGENAVKQAGASLMFTRDKDGKVDQATANAIKSLETIRNRNPEIRTEMKKIADFHRGNPDKRTVIENAVINSGYHNWDLFIDNKPNAPSAETITEIKKALADAGIIL